LLLLQSLHRIDAQNAYATPWLRDIVTEENLNPQTEANVAVLQNPRHLAHIHSGADANFQHNGTKVLQ
jgi:hypothetical protein